MIITVAKPHEGAVTYNPASRRSIIVGENGTGIVEGVTQHGQVVRVALSTIEIRHLAKMVNLLEPDTGKPFDRVMRA